MAIPEILKTWAAEEGDLPTSVIHPCYVDYRIVKELGKYHPGTLSPDRYRFKHVAWQEDGGAPHVRVTAISNDWNEKMQAIMKALRLYPEQINGVTVLLDKNIEHSQGAGLEMEGWKVVEWQVAKGRDAMDQVVHHDLIRWRKNSVEHDSLLSWRPYRQDGI